MELQREGAGKQSQIWTCPINICQLLNSLPGLFWKECSAIDNLLAIFPPSQILRLCSDSRQLGGRNRRIKMIKDLKVIWSIFNLMRITYILISYLNLILSYILIRFFPRLLIRLSDYRIIPILSSSLRLPSLQGSKSRAGGDSTTRGKAGGVAEQQQRSMEAVLL